MDLQALSQSRDLRFALISFTDLLGVQRAKLVPAPAFAQMVRDGARFAGSATWLDLRPEDPDLICLPDTEAAIGLPWQPEVAWLPGTCWLHGQELAQAPRNVLRYVLGRFAQQNLTVMTGVEPEFYLLDAAPHSDPSSVGRKPCYDQRGLMRRFGLFSRLLDHMNDLGWQPYQCDHEDGDGQFEINWAYAEALCTADRHSFFTFMLESLADAHGAKVSFQPKPFADQSGSGCHVHLSLWSRDDGKNQFLAPDQPFGLAPIGRYFMAGVLHHARALTALCNPRAESYQRLNTSQTRIGHSWAPSVISWSGDDRTQLVRVPAPGRIEVRLPDSAANPYLMQAGIMAAGLSGIARKLDPGAPGEPFSDQNLPGNLPEALDAFAQDNALQDHLGHAFSRAYLRVQRAQLG